MIDLSALRPRLHPERLVFISRPGSTYGDHAILDPLAAFQEPEGLTLLVTQTQADAAGFTYDAVLRRISLGAPAGLAALDLTAAVADRLHEHSVDATIVAAYYHDYMLAPAEHAELALAALDGSGDLTETLLTVDDATFLPGFGLVLSPGVTAPDSFRAVEVSLRVDRPDGTSLRVEGRLDPDTGAHRVAVVLTAVAAPDVPVGSAVRCSPATLALVSA